jgi:hypothetical protein
MRNKSFSWVCKGIPIVRWEEISVQEMMQWI